MKTIIFAACYVIFFTCLVIADEVGIASFYGNGEKLNTYTASGTKFSAKALSCASYKYKFGTKLRVTNLHNGKSVLVRVNDRGPNKKLGRKIDLTREAFSRIAPLKKGLIKVNIKRIY